MENINLHTLLRAYLTFATEISARSMYIKKLLSLTNSSFDLYLIKLSIFIRMICVCVCYLLSLKKNVHLLI